MPEAQIKCNNQNREKAGKYRGSNSKTNKEPPIGAEKLESNTRRKRDRRKRQAIEKKKRRSSEESSNDVTARLTRRNTKSLRKSERNLRGQKSRRAERYLLRSDPKKKQMRTREKNILARPSIRQQKWFSKMGRVESE